MSIEKKVRNTPPKVGLDTAVFAEGGGLLTFSLYIVDAFLL